MGKSKSNPSQKPKNPFTQFANSRIMDRNEKKVNAQNKGQFSTFAKSKALERRKKTILKEYKQNNKINHFSDKRIGEKSMKMASDDKFGSRFAALQKQKYKNISIDLPEGVLTHHGKTLNEIEKFEDVNSEDESEDMGAEFVEKSHFGGGILSHSKGTNSSSYKDLINNLILQSKLKKDEKKRTKEETCELTKELDDKLQPLLNLFKSDNNQPQINTIEEYDKKIKELHLNLSKRKMNTTDITETVDDTVRDTEKICFVFPEPFSTFQNDLSSKSNKEQLMYLKKLIKNCQNNGRHRQTICEYLFTYLKFIAQKAEKNLLSKSFSELFEIILQCLCELSPTLDNFYDLILETISQKHNTFRENIEEFPEFEVLAFLKLVCCLYSKTNSSVTNSCIVFIDQILSKCRVQTLKDVLYGLYFISIALEFCEFKKGFLPSVFNFLHSILYTLVQNDSRKAWKHISFEILSDLELTRKLKQNGETLNSLIITDAFAPTVNDELKLKIINTTLNLLQNAFKHCEEIPSQKELKEISIQLLKLLPLKLFPKEIQNLCRMIINNLDRKDECNSLSFLKQEKKKPPTLRLYEPNIQKVYEYKRNIGSSKEHAERNKLVQKYKKERKGAIRELRRDRMFLAKVKIQGLIEKDKERLSNVKRIFSEGNNQQAELNELKRKKNRKK